MLTDYTMIHSGDKHPIKNWVLAYEVDIKMQDAVDHNETLNSAAWYSQFKPLSPQTKLKQLYLDFKSTLPLLKGLV